MPPGCDFSRALFSAWRCAPKWCGRVSQQRRPATRSMMRLTGNLERQFWSFKPPLKSELPAVKEAGWPAQRLDHFVLAKMEAKGLKPAPEAGKRTLIRRVTFDLTGLPPTPEEVATFVSDNFAGRLPAACRPAPRLAALRRADGEHVAAAGALRGRSGAPGRAGHEILLPERAQYRDWVIDAFNRDLPYDQFVKLPARGGSMLNSDPCREHSPRMIWRRSAFSGSARSITIATDVSHGGRVGGPRRYGDAHVARADRRVRALPRSQVRSDHARAIITRWPACSRARGWSTKRRTGRWKRMGRRRSRWIPRRCTSSRTAMSRT